MQFSTERSSFPTNVVGALPALHFDGPYYNAQQNLDYFKDQFERTWNRTPGTNYMYGPFEFIKFTGTFTSGQSVGVAWLKGLPAAPTPAGGALHGWGPAAQTPVGAARPGEPPAGSVLPAEPHPAVPAHHVFKDGAQVTVSQFYGKNVQAPRAQPTQGTVVKSDDYPSQEDHELVMVDGEPYYIHRGRLTPVTVAPATRRGMCCLETTNTSGFTMSSSLYVILPVALSAAAYGIYKKLKQQPLVNNKEMDEEYLREWEEKLALIEREL